MRHQRAAGFTLIELVVVMIVVGILAVAARPRFFGTEFDELGFHDGVRAALQHARRVAVASRRYVCVTNTNGVGAGAAVVLAMDPTLPEANTAAINCTATINLPATRQGCAANAVCAPNGVALGGGNVWFDPLGRSVTQAKAVAALANITVSNVPTITVQPETGFVQ